MNITRKIRFFAAALFFAAYICACGSKSDADIKRDIVKEISSTPKLITTECIIRQIVTKNDIQTFTIGDRILVISIKARVKFGFDLSKITPDKIVMQNGDCIVELPNPEIISIESTIEDMKEFYGYFRSKYTDSEVAEVGAEATAKLKSAVLKLQLDKQVKDNAAIALIPFIKKLGFDEKNIFFKFADDFKMKTLIDNTKIEVQHQ